MLAFSRFPPRFLRPVRYPTRDDLPSKPLSSEILRKSPCTLCPLSKNVTFYLLRVRPIKNYLETNPKYYFNELEETISLLNTTNESLVEIFKQQKEEYKLIW